MNKYKVIIVLILGFGAAFIVDSCIFRCKSSHYRTDAIQGKAMRIIGIDSSNNINPKYILSDYTNNEIRYDSIGFQFKSIGHSITQKSFSNLGFSSAVACKPDFSYDIIKSVKITSNRDYNAEFPLGTDLQIIMRLGDYSNTGMDSVNNKINYVGTYGSLFLFKIIAPPYENQTHDLTFAFQLSSGNVLIAQINNVFITK